ncbi:MAG: hypothetical protein FJ271_15755 [Planctomycetes bacterium]|nr:hypothetical protein [Planctomycetota bacterium]
MSDQLILTNGKIKLVTEEGQEFDREEAALGAMFRQEMTPPMNGTAFPDGIKFHEWREPFYLVVHQTPPHVRQLRWIANDSPKKYGPGTTYRRVRVSIPYSITFAVFFQHGNILTIGPSNELYFRNEPLKNKNDTLGYPALLNISKIPIGKRHKAWICTQYLRCSPGADWVTQLHALLEHTWNGGFNMSSEHHEGASWYGESKNIHCNLHPVEKWEEATTAKESFARSVPWKPVPMNVGELMEAILDECQNGLIAGLAKPKAKKPASILQRFLNYAQKTK